jgi:murein peptide amidase A
MRVPLVLAVLLTGCVGFHAPVARPDGADAGHAAEASAGPDVWSPRWQTFGASHTGRPLRLTRLGLGARRVLWIGGIHGDEREGRVATAQLPRALRREAGALERVTLTIVDDVNPDGTAQGTRGNARGVDLNRNYPAANFRPSRFFGAMPLDQPEAKALHDLIRDERPHLVIVAHAWRGDHFVNFDGPAAGLAREFSRLSGYRVQPSDEIAPTPGSLGSWVGGTLGVPILTLEYQRGRDPWSAWLETRSAILAVVMGRER